MITRDLPELFKFVQNDNVWTYTSSEHSLAYNGDIYTPVAIQRGQYDSSEELSKSGISVEIDITTDLSNHFLINQGDFVTSLTIYKQAPHETRVIWKGRVASFSTSKNRMSFSCESVFASIARNGLTAKYQRTCRYNLYGLGCNVNKSSYALATTLDQVFPDSVNVPDAAGYVDNYFTGGVLEASDGSLAFIIRHTDSNLSLSKIPNKLKQDYDLGIFDITIYPGCSKTKSICESRFNNIINFGGFPWIPSKNPFGGSAIV